MLPSLPSVRTSSTQEWPVDARVRYKRNAVVYGCIFFCWHTVYLYDKCVAAPLIGSPEGGEVDGSGNSECGWVANAREAANISET